MYSKILRPILFQIDPEKVHHFIFKLFKIANKNNFAKKLIKRNFHFCNINLSREVFGIRFTNPVGLAAGFDKNAENTEILSNMGFGFIEIGTVTPKPQLGNPTPRLFRLPKDQALINRMGFNNLGLTEAIKRLENRNPNIVIGGNIGKNSNTPPELANNDYITCFKGLHDYVDYFVINISCPNIKDLRESQTNENLIVLLRALKLLNSKFLKPKPILLKISPDLTFEQLDDTIEIIQMVGIDGVVATNTTTSRENLTSDSKLITKIANGGLSGRPLTNKSTEIIRYIYKKTNGKLPIIGVGGIMSVKDALDKLNAGASLIQIYSGYIYQGPSFIKKINKAILKNNCTPDLIV